MTEALAASFAEGAEDPRVNAIVPMAGGDFERFGAAGLGDLVPTLQLTGEMDPGDGAAYWAAIQAEHHRVDILGAGHQAFTDFSGVLEDGGTIEAEAGFRIMRAYALAAVRSAGGDTSVATVLDGTTVIAAEAVVDP
jgi:hypothetical protein